MWGQWGRQLGTVLAFAGALREWEEGKGVIDTGQSGFMGAEVRGL
jgi:hypothetical protein